MPLNKAVNKDSNDDVAIAESEEEIAFAEAEEDTQIRRPDAAKISQKKSITPLQVENTEPLVPLLTAVVDSVVKASNSAASAGKSPVPKSVDSAVNDEVDSEHSAVGHDAGKLSFLARIDKTAERQRLRSQPEGTVLRGRFSLIKTLGSGGMGDVYLAKDLLREEMEDSSPYIALKLLNEDCQSIPGALQALQREAKKAQTLSHPNIVTVFDFDRCGDTAFISMEYLQGQTIKDYLADHGRMPHAKAMRVIELAARGLAYAHQKGFVHADIKPANVFLQTDDNVKILDFGIARAVNQVQEPSASDDLTAFALTPNYATVASLKGQATTEKDDVYALACVAYQLLTGRHPYTTSQGMPLSALDAQRLGARVENILGFNHRHMRALRKALRFDNGNGFNNAGEFIDAIKPRSHKRMVVSLVAAVGITLASWVGLQHYIESRVPSLESLPVVLAPIAELVREGDRSLRSDDLDLAHRFYSQAWFDAQTTSVGQDKEQLSIVQNIVAERINRVVTALIERAEYRSLSEFKMREYLAALEFFAQAEFVRRPHHVRKSIADLKQRIEQLP